MSGDGRKIDGGVVQASASGFYPELVRSEEVPGLVKAFRGLLLGSAHEARREKSPDESAA